MKNCLLIACWFVIVVLLVAGAGCSRSSHSNAQSLTALPKDVNSPDEAAFGEFETELSGKEIGVADPIEPINRTMYGLNDILYFWVAKPVTKVYADVIPQPARIGVGNFFHNLITPVRLVNCLLQGKGSEAKREVDRFAINTTVGVIGFGDPALDKYKIKSAEEDLGQTLAVYGLGDGFYVVLPLLGPSTLRDTGGLAGDAFLNPIWYVKPLEVSLSISAVRYTNEGSFHIGDYEAFKSASLDPYVAMREAYVEYRNKKIKE